jgi:membrane protease YdiL (CAAX protease family)
LDEHALIDADSRSPDVDWPPWMAPIALFGGVVLAAVGGLLLDIPAAVLFGVKITSSHLPPGLSIADTVVQDIGFVLVAVYLAQLGGRTVRSWQFGLRRPGVGWWAAGGLILLLLLSFIVLSIVWSEIVHPEKERTLEQLGSNEGAALLVLSAGLTCVVAPMCEEFLFRGFIFTSLRGWCGTLPAAVMTGLLFGGVHLGAGARPGAAGGARLRPVPAVPLHGLAVSVHDRPRAEQLCGVRRARELGLAGGRAGHMRAQCDRSGRAHGQAPGPDRAGAGPARRSA